MYVHLYVCGKGCYLTVPITPDFCRSLLHMQSYIHMWLNRWKIRYCAAKHGPAMRMWGYDRGFHRVHPQPPVQSDTDCEGSLFKADWVIWNSNPHLVDYRMSPWMSPSTPQISGDCIHEPNMLYPGPSKEGPDPTFGGIMKSGQSLGHHPAELYNNGHLLGRDSETVIRRHNASSQL